MKCRECQKFNSKAVTIKTSTEGIRRIITKNANLSRLLSRLSLKQNFRVWRTKCGVSRNTDVVAEKTM